MEIIDQSMFGWAIFLKNEGEIGSQIKMSSSNLEEISSKEKEGKNYHNFLQKQQELMGQKTFSVLNQKLVLLESILKNHVPGFDEIFKLLIEEEISKIGGRRRQSSLPGDLPIEYFTRLFIYKKAKKNKKIFQNIGENIVAIRYNYFSELMFLQTTDSVIIYDLFQKKIYQIINGWPFRIKNFIIRRNLNYYTMKKTLNLSYKRYENFCVDYRSNIKIKEITETNIKEFIFEFRSITKYFKTFSNEVFFQKKDMVDKYVLVFQFFKSNKLCFFDFHYCFHKFDKLSRRHVHGVGTVSSLKDDQKNLVKK